MFDFSSTGYKIAKDILLSLLSRIEKKKANSKSLLCRRTVTEDGQEELNTIIKKQMKKFSFKKSDTQENAKDIKEDAKFKMDDKGIDNALSIIKYVFSNHTFNKESINASNSKKSKKYRKRYSMTKDFHKNEDYYVDAHDFISLMDFSQEEKMEDKNLKPSDYLADTIIQSYADTIIQSYSGYDKNPLFLIQGSIGSGKSTLLSRTYTKLLAKRNELKLEPIVIFIDFQESFSKLLYTESDTDKAFEKLLNNLKTEVNKQSDNIFKTTKKRIKELPIIILLDNLDEVYEHFCKISFFDCFDNESGYEALKRYYPLLFKYINYFHGDESKKLYSGSITNVLCCRDDTMKLIKVSDQNVRGVRDSNINLDLAIKIIDPIDSDDCDNIGKGSLYTKEILISRMKMLSQYFNDKDIEDIEGIEGIKGIINSNIKLLKSSNIDYHEMNIISVQGLRHTMYLFSTVAFACLDEELFKRFFLEKDILRKLHFIGRKIKYSQINDGIANIFLLNRSYRLEMLKPDEKEPDYKKKIHEEIRKANHIHTFWLKYLILKAISSGKIINKSSLINVFTANGECTGYNKTAVELCLLSLAQVEHGRLIIPNVPEYKDRGKPYNISISKTTRAKYLLDNNIFFSYDYLSTILEDEWLTFIHPDNDIKGANEYKKIVSSLKDFSNEYLFEKDNEIFRKEAIKANKLKIPFVSLFIDILKESLLAEEKIKSDVFRHLRSDNVPINDIKRQLDSADEDIAKDLLKIEKFLEIKDSELTTLWDKHRAPRRDLKAHSPILLAKEAVKQIYKRHTDNPVIDKRA